MTVREQIYHIVEQLPENRLDDVLGLLQFVASEDYEAEEMWLLVSGNLKRLADTIDQAPEPVDDWRSHLRDL